MWESLHSSDGPGGLHNPLGEILSPPLLSARLNIWPQGPYPLPCAREPRLLYGTLPNFTMTSPSSVKPAHGQQPARLRRLTPAHSLLDPPSARHDLNCFEPVILCRLFLPIAFFGSYLRFNSDSGTQTAVIVSRHVPLKEIYTGWSRIGANYLRTPPMCCVCYTPQNSFCMAALEYWLTRKKRISKISQKLTKL